MQKGVLHEDKKDWSIIYVTQTRMVNWIGQNLFSTPCFLKERYKER
jgi:hypothetical protein